MTGTPIIGGKADGQTTPMRIPRLQLDGEVYMLVAFRDEQGEHFVYQIAGAKPNEVLEAYQERFNGKK